MPYDLLPEDDARSLPSILEDVDRALHDLASQTDHLQRLITAALHSRNTDRRGS